MREGTAVHLKALFALVLLTFIPLRAQTWNDFETPPHNYWTEKAVDTVTELHRRMERNQIALAADADPKTFLRAYLDVLKVPVSSQVLVFSKSSLQRNFVNGHNPRALYFNEDTYVGWMPGGLIEVTGIDPVLGGIFYIFKVPDKKGSVPVFERRRSCIGCHAGSGAGFLPGLRVRSLFTGEDGRTFGDANEETGGHHVPFDTRWGGWYVTGAPAEMKHRANAWSTRSGGEGVSAGAMDRIMPPGTHLAPGSDVLAMMLHDHQCKLVNVLMEANYRIRTALHNAGGDRPLLERPIPSDDMGMAREQARRVVSFLLFAGEIPLPAPVAGDTTFKTDFAANRRPDKSDRSLKDFDLKSLLMRYRCSYMIYSSAFDGLPPVFRKIVFSTLRSALTVASDTTGAHLPPGERTAVHEILTATLPGYTDQ
jgi:hypothetical protein